MDGRRLLCILQVLKRQWPILAVLLVGSSCNTLVTAPSGDVSRIPAEFAAALPESFTARQTLVFEFKPHWWWPTIRMTALGYASVNRKAGDYAVVCLSPLGVKLFDVACTNGVAETRMMLPIPGDRTVVGKAVSEDIRSLYFDLVPPHDAVVRRSGRQLVFSQGLAEYVFSGDTGMLVNKAVQNGNTLSKVTFGDYVKTDGLTYPATMILENRRGHYRITVRTVKLDVKGKKDNTENTRAAPATPLPGAANQRGDTSSHSHISSHPSRVSPCLIPSLAGSRPWLGCTLVSPQPNYTAVGG